jgi:hypothetical protein
MDDLKQPGAWLDTEMSEAEGAQVIELSKIMAQLASEKDPDKIIKAVTPYMNSFMHLMYLFVKSKLDLEATDDGVRYRENKELYFDIISYTVDFVINKYDFFTLSQMTPEQLSSVITNNLLSRPYLPMLNGALVNDFMQINTRGLAADKFSKRAVYVTKDGHKFTIEHFDKLLRGLSTPAKKILNMAIMFLTANNYYNADRITPTVEIPLIDYGEKCGYQLTPRKMATLEEQAAEDKAVHNRIVEFKKDVRRDLRDIAETKWTAEETRGRNKGDYAEMRIISSHRIIKGLIRINFDVDAAAYLVHSPVMQHPMALFAVDNRNPNAYVLGYKIALHNSNDNNAARGTNNTLSVKSLLAAAPEIQSYEELQARGQRNWKDKIKKPLENSLNELVKRGVLSKWEYRDPTTGTTYTPETAQPMTWAQYSRLMVDFIMVNAPDQTERREAKAEAAQAAADKEKPRKKRGRPSKRG